MPFHLSIIFVSLILDAVVPFEKHVTDLEKSSPRPHLRVGVDDTAMLDSRLLSLVTRQTKYTFSAFDFKKSRHKCCRVGKNIAKRHLTCSKNYMYQPLGSDAPRTHSKPDYRFASLTYKAQICQSSKYKLHLEKCCNKRRSFIYDMTVCRTETGYKRRICRSEARKKLKEWPSKGAKVWTINKGNIFRLVIHYPVNNEQD